MEELINQTWTWEEAFDAYKDELVFNEHSEDAVKVRLITLNAFSRLAKKNDLLPATVTKLIVKEYFTSRDIKTTTKVSQKAYLNHFYEFLVESFVVLENVVGQIKSPKIKSKERTILNQNEIVKIYKFIAGQKSGSISERDSIILDLFLVPALRVKELSNLKIKDLFIDELKIKVLRKGGKEQFLPIQKDTAAQIQIMLDKRDSCLPEENLFLSSRRNRNTGEYGPLAKRTIQDNIHKYLSLNCLDNKTNFGPHLLRHTGATQMIKQGANIVTVQKILGHEDIKTTMIYMHTNFEDMQNVVQSTKRTGA